MKMKNKEIILPYCTKAWEFIEEEEEENSTT